MLLKKHKFCHVRDIYAYYVTLNFCKTKQFEIKIIPDKRIAKILSQMQDIYSGTIYKTLSKLNFTRIFLKSSYFSLFIESSIQLIYSFFKSVQFFQEAYKMILINSLIFKIIIAKQNNSKVYAQPFFNPLPPNDAYVRFSGLF